MDANTLHSARLRLEPVDQRHYDGLRAINSDPEVMRYITGRAETAEETAAFVARNQAQWIDPGYGWWAMVEAASGDVVGTGCVQHIERNPANPLELGWRLRADRQGKGYATEAARAMARFAFEHLQAQQLVAVCRPENAASAAVMLRLGMRLRGIERWYETDTAVYALARRDWHSE